jgi:hypothetical protein
MTKTIDTLVEDIYAVIDGNGGWDETVNSYFSSRIMETMEYRLVREKEEKGGTIRMSNVGQPCERKLWYHVNYEPSMADETIQPHVLLKFMYGDILEDLLLSLAKAAGHSVSGEQDEVVIAGIKGHRDAVIDGVVVDVKSASTYAFDKFKNNALREEGNDSFGYIRQLAGYVAAAKDDPLVTDKKKGAFLVIDKTRGHLCLDVYDLSDEIASQEEFIEARKEVCNKLAPPPRPFTDEPYQKSGNRKLVDAPCGFCEWKKTCWPGVRTFAYAGRKPIHLTKVVREPKAMEVT